MSVEIQETYSSALVNYTESVNINGIEYTRFYTELNTNLNVGDYVYILNGNYDNSILKSEDNYQKGANGYRILEIDKNSIVLDIPFRNESPFNEDLYEDYTKVYVVNSLEKFYYENSENNFESESFLSQKYNSLNNNIFLSQIENLPYTNETQTNGKFFKSYDTLFPDLSLTNLRGQVFDHQTVLKFDTEESSVYGLVSTGLSGSTGNTYSIPPGLVNDILTIDVDLLNNAVISVLTETIDEDSYLFYLDKTTFTSKTLELKNIDESNIHISYIKSLTDIGDTVVQLPSNGSETYYYLDNQGIQRSITGNGVTYSVELDNKFVGFSVFNSPSVNFYSSTNDVKIPYDPSDPFLGATSRGYDNIDYTSSYMGIDPDSKYMVAQNDTFNTSNTVVLEFSTNFGIPTGDYPVRFEINKWDSINGSKQLEYCIAYEEGLFFYNFAGSWIDQDDGFKRKLGNSLMVDSALFNAYKNPANGYISINGGSHPEAFENISTYPFNNVLDIRFLGEEEKSFTLSDVSISTLPYSKYLVITEEGKKYYIYVNLNLYDNGQDAQGIIGQGNEESPQAYLYVEYIGDTESDKTIIGGELENEVPVTGKYLLANNKGGEISKVELNSSFSEKLTISSTLSVYDIELYDNKIFLSTSDQFDFRIINTSNNYGLTGNGIYIYEESGNSNPLNITTSTSIVGDNLPSNDIFKIKSETFNGKKRIWAATTEGLYMLEYSGTQYIYSDYYYTVDFDNNDIPLNDDLPKNNRIYVVEDFEYDGISFKKGKIYKHNRNKRLWEIDNTYIKPYITKAHFKDGTFGSESILNDGIFGNLESTANWNNGVWRNGILYNSIWSSGSMNSKSDEDVEQTYYSSLINGKINVTTDFENNSSFGYNYIIDSQIISGSISNGNLDNTIMGSYNGNLLDSIYSNNTYNYNEISITSGLLINSDIYSSDLSNVRIENSNIYSSKISNNSVVINSNMVDSYITSAIIENEGIKIIGYDRWYNIKNKDEGQEIIQIHKFFIEEKDFDKINYGDSIILNNLKIDSDKYTNIFDNIFYLLSGDDGYYLDNYIDLNSIEDNSYKNNSLKVFVSKRNNRQNVNKTNIDYNGINLITNEFTYSNPRYSIDVAFVVKTIPNGSSEGVYEEVLNNDGILRISVTDFSKATIQYKFLKNSWLNGGDWLNGSVINPSQLMNKYDSNNKTIIDGYTISIHLNEELYGIKSSDIVNNEDIVYINNILGTSSNTHVSGSAKLISGTNSRVLRLYSDSGLSSEWTIPTLNQYTFVSLNRIDGINNDLTIKGGLFKNQYLSNLTLNSTLDFDNLNLTNIRKLSVINTDISDLDNLNINNVAILNSSISNRFGDSIININGILIKSVLYGTDIKSGFVTKSAILSGSFSNGEYFNNKYSNINDLIPINNFRYNTTEESVLPIWHSGDFKSGVFRNSIWLSGDFSNGSMLNSEFLGGDFTGGKFGDSSSRSNLNIIRKGHWYNGIFENGIFGDNSNEIQDVDAIYTSNNYILDSNYYQKNGVNIWEEGDFNNGIFTNIDGYVSIWKDGNFNNGQISGEVIWYNGIFNNGKFKSTYGRYISTVWGEENLPFIAASVNLSIGASSIIFKNYYNSDLSFLNKRNIASIRDKHGDNNINNPGTLILDTYDNRLKFIYLSDSGLSSPFGTDLSSHGYSEKALDDFYNDPSSSNIRIETRRLDFSHNGDTIHPLHDSETLGAKIYVQDTGNEYIFNGTGFVDKDTFLSSTISNTSFTYSSIYAWRNGVFNNGEFGDQLNAGNKNPSWENGTFNGGKFYGKKWKEGTFIRGEFRGFGVRQSQQDSVNIFEGYNPQATVYNYMNDFNVALIGTVSSNQTNYKITLDNYQWYGLWLNGNVPIGISEVERSNKFEESILIDNFNEDRYNRKKVNVAKFNNMLWVDGEFNNPDSEFNESVFLKGIFKNGVFNNSLFNPYVKRWDFDLGDIVNAKYCFELDQSQISWDNGVFNSGVFYAADWNNGTFENGTMVGGYFKNGRANYISAFNTIWENGRYRNGNWYGSNWTLNNIYGDDSVPNPFEYLGDNFSGKFLAPFITDILGLNAKRLQDDKIHVWNIVEGTTALQDYDYSSANFSNAVYTKSGGGSPGNSGFYDYTATLSEIGVSHSVGILNFNLTVINSGSASTSIDLTPITSEDTISSVLTSGLYEIKIYTNPNDESYTKPAGYIVFDFYIDAYKYDENGILVSTDVIRKNGGAIQFTIPEGWEYRLRARIESPPISLAPETNWDVFVDINKEDATDTAFYGNDNNTLNGYSQFNYEGDYLSSTISIATSSHTYIDTIFGTTSVQYSLYDYVTVSIPYTLTEFGGAYTQFGNGAFLEGIWENGVWNNGYRGTELGTIISNEETVSSTQIYTYSSGLTASVELNPLYLDTPKIKYRTSPIIYFSSVQRSFKVSRNIWRFVLESSFNINGSIGDNYNKLNISDQVSVGNIIAIDINGNRKLIKDVFTVVSISNNTITLEYSETFPIDNITIDSDRHLIYVTKNVWVNGAYLNGYFEGIMMNSFIRGNRSTTKLVNSHLINVTYRGAQLIGTKKDISEAFDYVSNNIAGISPQFQLKYDNKYHSSLIQNMEFYDDVSFRRFNNIHRELGITVSSSSSEDKIITYGGTESSPNTLQYLYNSDLDLVYEPEIFSSIFNQNMFNNLILNNSNNKTTGTNIYNIPAGYITYDVLSSRSRFTYTSRPEDLDEVNYDLSLGSKMTKFNSLFTADFSDNVDINTDIPSTFNVLESASYSIYVRGSLDDGITFGNKNSQFIHEPFIYTFPGGSTMSLISGGDNFRTRNRYSVVEVDVEFQNNQTYTNPYNTSGEINISTTYSFGTGVPKLSIGQGYNELYEPGYLSPYDNNIIRFIDKTKQSEINNFGNSNGNRFIMKSYFYNNFGGYRDTVKMIEKDFTESTGGTSSSLNINTPVYYSFKHYELDQIPFYKYQDFFDPLTGTVSEWNVGYEGGNLTEYKIRSVDERVKTPFYATSVPIDYDNDNFVLTDNINFLGGTNILSNNVVEFNDTGRTSLDDGNEDIEFGGNSGGNGGFIGGGGSTE
jgi:hypothetical protein